MAALSDQQLYAITQKYFGDLGQGVVNTMFQIAKRESGGNPAAKNLTGPDRSYGLWQINTIAGANPDMLKYNLTDPEQNAQAAREVYDRAGPSAWSTYSGGGGSVPPAQGSSIDPLQVIDATLRELMASPPQASDYTIDDGQGNQIPDTQAFKAASDAYHQHISDFLALRKSYSDQNAGMFTLPDGTIVTQAALDAMDPATRAQVETQLANQNTDRQNKYNELMNSLGLTEFTTGQNSAGLENNRLSTDFQNQLGSYREKLALDQANQNTGLNKIDRQLRGMTEARSRAQVSMDALQAAAPWGTSGGKTSFSANDLGGGVAGLAGKGNLNPNTPLMNFPGVQTVDPNSMFNFYDNSLGVSGQLPQVPDLTTTPGMIPQAPNSIPIQQGAPQMTPYTPYQNVPIPQATQPPLIDGTALLHAISGFGGLNAGGSPAAAQPPVQRGFVPMPPLITPLTTAVTNQYLR